MILSHGYAAKHSFSRLKPIEIEREEAGPDEVQIDILYCGVCHSDIHQCENDWSNTVNPCMPGHEIVGRVVAAGANVKRHLIGDLVGVGQRCLQEGEGRGRPLSLRDRHGDAEAGTRRGMTTR